MKKITSILAISLFVGLISFNPTNETKDHYFEESDDYALKQEKTIKFNKRMSKNPNVSFDDATEDGAMISNAKAQILDNGNNTYNIRFVSALVWSDTSAIYSRIGFDINYYYNNEWFSYSRDVSTLYTTLVAGSKTFNESNMSEFDNTSNYKYFATYTLINIPSSALDIHFEVRPYAYSLDGVLYSSKGSKVTSVNSVKDGYSTYKVFSKFENNYSSEIKYVEPVHDRNKQNEVVGEGADDVDKTVAEYKVNKDGIHYIENASAYGKFTYTYESKSAKGKLDIYANVSSNGSIGGDISTIWPGAREGFIGSKPIDFSKFMTLTNNDKEFKVSEDAYIPEVRLTSDADSSIIGADVTKSAWSTCTYLLLNNFRRIHIGTVDIVEGINDISINLNYYSTGFGYGYCNSICGNWKDIEFIYVDDSIDKTVASVKTKTLPTKLNYEIGEELVLDGAEFEAYNQDGVYLGLLDNSKIEINNKKLFESGKVELKYQNVEFYVDVIVSNIVKQDLNTLDNMTIKYYDVDSTSDTRRAALDTTNSYLEKVSSGSYFEYVIDSDKERTISISAEIATNAYLTKAGDTNYKDYDTGIEGFNQSYIGSYDLDMSRIVKLSNTINDVTTEFDTNKNAIAKGHVINAEDDAEIAKNYRLPAQQWEMADDLCTKKFENLELGEIKLSKGTNIVRITLNGYLAKNTWSFGGYACGNWKSISITFK